MELLCSVLLQYRSGAGPNQTEKGKKKSKLERAMIQTKSVDVGSGAGLSFTSQLDSMTSCWSRGRLNQLEWFLGKSRLVTRLSTFLLVECSVY